MYYTAAQTVVDHSYRFDDCAAYKQSVSVHACGLGWVNEVSAGIFRY